MWDNQNCSSARSESDDRIRIEVGVALQHLPVLVTGHERNLLNLQACFKQTARAFMAKIMKVQVFNSEIDAGPSERRPDRSGIMRKDAAR